MRFIIFAEMNSIRELFQSMMAGDKRALARCISLVENESAGFEEILLSLVFRKNVPIIGITGPPGAGKSTLVSRILKEMTGNGKSVGVIAVDPTSPFTDGSLLGDRLRMSDHFLNPDIFIRSLATRGSLGGLSAKAIEISDIMRAFGFDCILLETVGVGQNEVEIAGLADTTVLVLVPESGDEVQTLKSGIMEIADIFVVNKSDRDGADLFVKNLLSLVGSRHDKNPVLQTVATTGEGIPELVNDLSVSASKIDSEKKLRLWTEKASRLIAYGRMRNLNKTELEAKLRPALLQPNFNLYQFVSTFIKP
ncbi:MAG: methylmalonyl Co-A mutase-associated GTPase MeaB [Bacteroidia bacterium]